MLQILGQPGAHHSTSADLTFDAVAQAQDGTGGDGVGK